MKVTTIIQARMGSTRLPGKVMKKIKGITILEHVVNRIKTCKNINEIVIATTVKKDDNIIVELAKRLCIKYYRGDENDVLSRYYHAAKENNSDVVVRITSDCPVIDPEIIDKMMDKFIEFKNNSNVDYMSNTIERTFPRGLDAEIFTFDVLERAFNEADKSYQREHVTPYIYQNPEKFIIQGYKSEENYSKYRWTLDTIEDFQVIEKIYDSLYSENHPFMLSDIIGFILKNPKVSKINECIEQKKLCQ